MLLGNKSNLVNETDFVIGAARIILLIGSSQTFLQALIIGNHIHSIGTIG